MKRNYRVGSYSPYNRDRDVTCDTKLFDLSCYTSYSINCVNILVTPTRPCVKPGRVLAPHQAARLMRRKSPVSHQARPSRPSESSLARSCFNHWGERSRRPGMSAAGGGPERRRHGLTDCELNSNFESVTFKTLRRHRVTERRASARRSKGR